MIKAKCFSDSQRAYTSGNGEAAHQLSLEGKEHQRLKDQYNDQAAEWIFNENNKVQPRGSVDLHGLYVQESIEFTERAIDVSFHLGLATLGSALTKVFSRSFRTRVTKDWKNSELS